MPPHVRPLSLNLALAGTSQILIFGNCCALANLAGHTIAEGDENFREGLVP